MYCMYQYSALDVLLHVARCCTIREVYSAIKYCTVTNAVYCKHCYTVCVLYWYADAVYCTLLLFTINCYVSVPVHYVCVSGKLVKAKGCLFVVLGNNVSLTRRPIHICRNICRKSHI